eukprot:CAMPEP_0117051114 /NCGR_PEP_ID=MMETSP0472-20121206/35292_1 /TAXON_ID=693140 ORGANISM="Tiarina fusus, Strain LIS" /NCGR_SAMPLE_ID=MMETSP0472 /ASSEMBLY_ACC=CAM_ASM_000603 /LENGTH=59 /DNA_ID=CAMNT_0004765155 /DNA_START=14 /DNA_END=190 /DNA_ORIENTATION=-
MLKDHMKAPSHIQVMEACAIRMFRKHNVGADSASRCLAKEHSQSSKAQLSFAKKYGVIK